jgi:hypothetical protein
MPENSQRESKQMRDKRPKKGNNPPNNPPSITATKTMAVKNLCPNAFIFVLFNFLEILFKKNSIS